MEGGGAELRGFVTLWIYCEEHPNLSGNLVFLTELILFKEREEKNKQIEKILIMEAVMSHSKPYRFTHISLLASVHPKESLVWFEGSGYCYSINAGPSLGLFLHILLLSSVVEMLQFGVCRNGLHML